MHFSFFKGLDERKYIKSTSSKNMKYMRERPDFLFHNYNTNYALGLFGVKNIMHYQPSNLLFFGWVIGTPAYESHLKYHGLESGHLRGLYEKEEIRLISQENVITQLLEIQMNERFDGKVNLEVIDTFDGSKVYKVKK